MVEEIWKDIPHYEGRYQASSLGRIRSCDRYSNNHFWKQQILKQKLCDASGYRVCLWEHNKPHYWLVARLVANAFLGESNLTVNHIDGNRLNNNIDNLEWCSIAENIKKGFALGLYDRTMKKIKVINKRKQEECVFRSMTKADIYVKKSVGYLSGRIQKGIYENENYKWELI